MPDPTIYEQVQAMTYTTKTALDRFREGDDSPQVVAELAAYYVRLVETRHERYNELNRQSIDDIWERYKELELHHTGNRIQYWAGKAVKTSMITPILTIEYPIEAYVAALKDAGVDPMSIYHYSHLHIGRKR